MPLASRNSSPPRRPDEGGYALAALLCLMTVIAFVMVSAAPRLKFQAQREREERAIESGEEVAEAIALYAEATNGALPTSIDQLLEGVPAGTKRRQVLRRYAARNPLSPSGKWRLIEPTGPELIKFQRAVTRYAGGVTPATRHPSLRLHAERLRAFAAAVISDRQQDEEAGDAGDRPFIGVACGQRRASIIVYYGLAYSDEWVFTPLFR